MKIGLKNVQSTIKEKKSSKKSIGILTGIVVLLGGLVALGRTLVKKKDDAE